jgi:hypothetical protein
MRILRYVVRCGRYNEFMQHELQIHPDSACAAVRNIKTQLTRRANDLVLQYAIRGAIGELRIPELTSSRRVDTLWQHTCCEAFIGLQGSDVYYEFNFSPSTAWAAYRFEAYRAGMKIADIEPSVHVRRGDDLLEVQAEFDIARLGNLSGARVGLSAVIEEINGRKSYWAFAHAPGKPDFHRADCFTLQLPPN